MAAAAIGMAAAATGTVDGVAAGAASDPASPLALAPVGVGAAIPIMPSPTTPSRLAAGRACVSGGTDAGTCGAPGAAGDGVTRETKKAHQVWWAFLILEWRAVCYFHSRTSTKW